MKKLLFISLTAIILFSCCRGIDTPETGGSGGNTDKPEVLPEETKLEIKFYYLDKSGQKIDSTFKDLNVILINNSYGKSYRFFSLSDDFYSGRVSNGNYDVFVVGNWGELIGEMSKKQLFELQYKANNASAINQNIMVAHDNFYLSKDTSFYYIVERLASQLEAKVALAEGVIGSVLSLQPKDCAGATPLFPSTDYTPEDVYYDDALVASNTLITTLLTKNSKTKPHISVLADVSGEQREYKVPFELTRAVNCNYQIVVGESNNQGYTARKSEAVFYSGMPKFAFGDYTHFDKLVWNVRTAYMELNMSSAQVNNSFKISFKTLRGTFSRNWRMEYMEQGKTGYTKMDEGTEIVVDFKSGDELRKVVNFAFSNDNTTENRPINNLFIFTVRDDFGYRRDVLVRTAMNL